MKTLILDGDVMVYKASQSAQENINWGDGLWTTYAREKNGTSYYEDYLSHLLEETGCEDVVVGLTDYEVTPWRLSHWPTYKCGRDNSKRPVLWAFMRSWIQENFKTYIKPGLEGDDICGILATHPTLVKGEKVFASIDKDFYTIPGSFYHMLRPQQGVVEIPVAKADYNHMLQTLTGDKTDDYPGCPSVGPVKATTILDRALSLEEPFWPHVVAAYQDQGLGEEFALSQARVARICRYTDYDFKKKEVIPWSPTSYPAS